MLLKELFLQGINKIQDRVYDYKTVRLKPSDWVEQNIYLTTAESPFPGFFKYDRSPYTREIIDCLSPDSPYSMIACMKNNQSGFTMGLIVPGICYVISENPANTMFVSGTDELARDTVRDKLDPVIQNSGISHLIRSSDTRKRNSRTGNTDFKKEFAGGTLNSGSYKPSNLRMHSAKNIFADEFDDAARNDKKEGNIRTLLENRTTAFPHTKKILYLSTPTTKGQSNIEDVYLLGDQRHFHWLCPHCEKYIDVLWQVEREDGSFGGIKYKLDGNSELIKDNIYYECQECGGHIQEREKYNLNLSGKWIPTAKPYREDYISFNPNAIFTFDKWSDLVYQWLEANPPGKPIDEGKLKSFVNTKLAQTWEERGTTPKVSDLMMNQTKAYKIGQIPDLISLEEGSGAITLVTLAVDLGGVMEKDNHDVRVDWEIVAHTSRGITWRIDHGSIGTFKNTRQKTAKEKKYDDVRERFTYAHGQPNSVWPVLKGIIERNIEGQSGRVYDIDMTAIDTSHFTKYAYDFINSLNNPFVVGIKGYEEADYRKLSRDTPIIKMSQEQRGRLYILQVNQLKDILAANMKLETGMDYYKPSGFMSYPDSDDGKFTMKGYFSHYEGEHRTQVIKDGVEVAYAWKKKHSSVQNHFFDTAVYTLAAREIFIDILRRSDSQNKELTWEGWCELIESNIN